MVKISDGQSQITLFHRTDPLKWASSSKKRSARSDLKHYNIANTLADMSNLNSQNRNLSRIKESLSHTENRQIFVYPKIAKLREELRAIAAQTQEVIREPQMFIEQPREFIPELRDPLIDHEGLLPEPESALQKSSGVDPQDPLPELEEFVIYEGVINGDSAKEADENELPLIEGCVGNLILLPIPCDPESLSVSYTNMRTKNFHHMKNICESCKGKPPIVRISNEVLNHGIVFNCSPIHSTGRPNKNHPKPKLHFQGIDGRFYVAPIDIKARRNAQK